MQSRPQIEQNREMARRNLLRCPHWLDVLGRRDWIGNDASYVIEEHAQFYHLAQKATEMQNALRKIQHKAISLILTVCHDSNSYNHAEYSFEVEPSPHHMGRPESEEYRFEKEWREKELEMQSNKLVSAWEDLIRFKNSSEQARYAINFYWKQQVGSYEDRYGRKMYRMKSFLVI